MVAFSERGDTSRGRAKKISMHHLTANIFFTVACVGVIVIAGCSLYYQTRAINNIRPDSRWNGIGIFKRRGRWIPRAEFNERGVFYRGRWIMIQCIFAAWVLACFVLSILLFGRQGN